MGIGGELRAPRFSAALTFCLYLAICIASYVHSDPITNDFERFHDLRLTFAFFAIFVGLLALYLALVGERAIRLDRRALLAAGACAVPLLLSFPVGSRDVFAYSFYGKMWGHYGVIPYLQPPTAFSSDSWYPFLQAWWKAGAAGYGPVFILETRALYALTGDRLAAAVAGYKLVDLLLLAASLWPMRMLAAAAAPDAEDPGEAIARGERAAALWLWSPLVLFETLGSAHNDLAMAVLLLAAACLWVRGRWMPAAACFALSFWYKWYSAVLVPVWLFWWLRRCGLAPALRRIAAAVGVAAAISVLVLIPFRREALLVITRPFDIKVGSVLFPDELPPPLWILFRALLSAGVLDQPSGRGVFDLIRFGLFFVGLGALLWRRRSSVYSAQRFLEDLCWTLLLFFSFVVTVLWPWHLLSPLLFALASTRRLLEQVAVLLTTVAVLSYFLTFMYALLLCGLIVGALWAMRSLRPQAG